MLDSHVRHMSLTMFVRVLWSTAKWDGYNNKITEPFYRPLHHTHRKSKTDVVARLRIYEQFVPSAWYHSLYSPSAPKWRFQWSNLTYEQIWFVNWLLVFVYVCAWWKLFNRSANNVSANKWCLWQALWSFGWCRKYKLDCEVQSRKSSLLFCTLFAKMQWIEHDSSLTANAHVFRILTICRVEHMLLMQHIHTYICCSINIYTLVLFLKRHTYSNPSLIRSNTNIPAKRGAPPNTRAICLTRRHVKSRSSDVLCAYVCRHCAYTHINRHVVRSRRLVCLPLDAQSNCAHAPKRQICETFSTSIAYE